MLTNAEMDYLRTLGKAPLVLFRAGARSIVGGDEQYSADLASPDLTAYKSTVKNEISDLVDRTIVEKHPRATNQRYRAKHHEALLFKQSAYLGSASDFNYLSQEASERGITMTQMADLIISAANTSAAGVAQMERRRINFNNAVDSALTVAAVYTLKMNAIAAIEAM